MEGYGVDDVVLECSSVLRLPSSRFMSSAETSVTGHACRRITSPLPHLRRCWIVSCGRESIRSGSPAQNAVEHSMKKEELEAILGDGENTPDLGPIEDYLHAVATEPKLPDFAVGMCAARIEEAAPKLRAVMLRAAYGKELSDDESLLLFRGLHILGGARDRESCQPLLRLLRRPSRNSTVCSAISSLKAWPTLSLACSTTISTPCSP